MSRLSGRQTNLLRSQTGQAAIFITVILVLVMGIIALGVNGVLGRNIRSALNYRQSIQAGYAAESGVNDAIYALQNGAALTSINPNSCTGFSASLPNSTLSSSPAKVGYTCLTVNPTPATLAVNVAWAQSAVIRLNPSQPTKSLLFSWGPSNANPVANCKTSLQIVPSSNEYLYSAPTGTIWNCPYSVLRVDVFNQGQPASYFTSPQTLENYTRTFFFFPVSGGTGVYNNVSFNMTSPGITSNAGQPLIVPAKCDSSSCQVSLTGLSPNLTDGYARLYSIYSDAGNVTVSGDPGLTFVNSQVEINATGINQDELRRVDVRVPLTPLTATAPQIPNYAVDAAQVFCKRFDYYTLNGTITNDRDLTYTPSADGTQYPLCGNALKPAIYLYPTQPEPVNVKVFYPTGFKTTIPTYDPLKGWNVIAQPDGTLTDLTNGQSYPYLYWEGNYDSFNFDMSKGFVVPGKDTASFLKHELTVIGLNKNEIADFLQYWVPKMKNNPYSLIHFATSEYTAKAPMIVSPKPDSVLRLFMAEKPISQTVQVTPQSFTTFQRHGFSVVEWGGTILN